MAHVSGEIGILFTTLVLVTGPLWAKPVWGVWWTWDARLTATLVLWLVYIAYLMVRNYAVTREQGSRFAAVVGIVGFVDVPIVFIAVKLWRTQHPSTIVFEGGLTSEMVLTLLISITAFTLLYVVLLIQGWFLRKVEAEVYDLSINTKAD